MGEDSYINNNNNSYIPLVWTSIYCESKWKSKIYKLGKVDRILQLEFQNSATRLIQEQRKETEYESRKMVLNQAQDKAEKQ